MKVLLFISIAVIVYAYVWVFLSKQTVRRRKFKELRTFIEKYPEPRELPVNEFKEKFTLLVEEVVTVRSAKFITLLDQYLLRLTQRFEVAIKHGRCLMPNDMVLFLVLRGYNELQYQKVVECAQKHKRPDIRNLYIRRFCAIFENADHKALLSKYAEDMKQAIKTFDVTNSEIFMQYVKLRSGISRLTKVLPFMECISIEYAAADELLERRILTTLQSSQCTEYTFKEISKLFEHYAFHDMSQMCRKRIEMQLDETKKRFTKVA